MTSQRTAASDGRPLTARLESFVKREHLTMDWRRPQGPAAYAGSRRWKFLSQAACLISQAPSGRWQLRRERGEFRFRDRRRHQL